MRDIISWLRCNEICFKSPCPLFGTSGVKMAEKIFPSARSKLFVYWWKKAPVCIKCGMLPSAVIAAGVVGSSALPAAHVGGGVHVRVFACSADGKVNIQTLRRDVCLQKHRGAWKAGGWFHLEKTLKPSEDQPWLKRLSSIVSLVGFGIRGWLCWSPYIIPSSAMSSNTQDLSSSILRYSNLKCMLMQLWIYPFHAITGCSSL